MKLTVYKNTIHTHNKTNIARKLLLTSTMLTILAMNPVLANTATTASAIDFNKIPPLPPMSNATMLPPIGDHSISEPPAYDYGASKIVNARTETLNKELTNTQSDENVIMAKKTGIANVTNIKISKTGNTTSEDNSNFYGQNAAILATPSSTIYLNGTTINTDANGANAVFASGKNANIEANNISIHTKQDSSRGLDATYNGVVIGKQITITTEGAHSATLATDRGEGTINVSEATLHTSGQGSPLIYSTGNITLQNGVGEATGSEIGVIEGKNSITIVNSNLTGHVDNGFMLYQSFSGDAESGIAQLDTSNSKLTTYADGAFIHVNNTQATATLENNEIIMPNTNILIKAAANRWGTKGENGGHLTFTAKNQQLTGQVIADSISTINLSLTNGSILTGSINPDNQAQAITLTLSKDSIWNVTEDSNVTTLTNEDPTNSNIHTNGHIVKIAGTVLK